MKFTRYTFLIAGIYGLLVLVPQYFMEAKVGVDNPPAITHPEYFYGFVGVAVAFQLVFIIISTDPLKYRRFIPACLVEKFSFGLAVAVLVLTGRTSGPIIAGAAGDLLLGILFTVSWFTTAKQPTERLDTKRSPPFTKTL
jgi:protein-S-isoprenylcysteine O-methyltransferase Ste14